MTIHLKLLVDKKNNKVAFAECNGDFVNVLFSFLTLPLGTIVRLLDKKSGLGCLDTLYRSVEKLRPSNFETPSCRLMLLRPRSTAEELCENLPVKLDELPPLRLFRCPKLDSIQCSEREGATTHPHYCSVAGMKCPCGQLMNTSNLVKRKTTEGKIFVESATRFIVSDDLHVEVASSLVPSGFLLEKMGVSGTSKLKAIDVLVDTKQVLHLLKRSLISKTPLSDVFLKCKNRKRPITDVFRLHMINLRAFITKKSDITSNKIISNDDKAPDEPEPRNSYQGKVIKIKIVKCKSSAKALLMQSENDFADLLFSFLTFPLGSALSLLGKSFASLSPGCIHHLYNSVNNLKDGKEEIMSAATKDMLLNPKLPAHFGCSSPILNVDELQSQSICFMHSCNSCSDELRPECSPGVPEVTLTELNPKLQNTCAESGGGFARSSAKFIIRSDMTVEPISAASTIQLVNDLGLSLFDGLQEKEVAIGETEVKYQAIKFSIKYANQLTFYAAFDSQALNLLLACLTTNVIETKKKQTNDWNMEKARLI